MASCRRPSAEMPVTVSLGAEPADCACAGTNPLLYINLELGKDQLIEVKCAYHEAVSAALKRCAEHTGGTRLGAGGRLQAQGTGSAACAAACTCKNLRFC